MHMYTKFGFPEINWYLLKLSSVNENTDGRTYTHGQKDGHMEDIHETIIPCYYHVAAIKKRNNTP